MRYPGFFKNKNPKPGFLKSEPGLKTLILSIDKFFGMYCLLHYFSIFSPVCTHTEQNTV